MREQASRHFSSDDGGSFLQQQAKWEARSELALSQMSQAMAILKCAPPPIRRRISELFQSCEHSNHEQVEKLASAERQLENLHSEYRQLHRDRKRELSGLFDEIAGIKDLIRVSVHLRGGGGCDSSFSSGVGSSAAALRAAADNLDLRAEMARLRLELDAARVENFKLSAELEAVRSNPPRSADAAPHFNFAAPMPNFGDPSSSSSSCGAIVYEQEECMDDEEDEEEQEEEEDEEGLLASRHGGSYHSAYPRAGAAPPPPPMESRFSSMDASDLSFFETLPPPPSAPSPVTAGEYPVPPASYAQTLSNLKPAAPILAPASHFELPQAMRPAKSTAAPPSEEERGDNRTKGEDKPAPSAHNDREGEGAEEEGGFKTPKKKAGVPRPRWVPLEYQKNPPKYPCLGPRRKKRKSTSSSSSSSRNGNHSTTNNNTTNVTEHHHHVHHHYIASTASSPDNYSHPSPPAALSLSPSPCASPVGAEAV